VLALTLRTTRDAYAFAKEAKRDDEMRKAAKGG
jgi:hypothetical protein